jgi:hypothetical protein
MDAVEHIHRALVAPERVADVSSLEQHRLPALSVHELRLVAVCGWLLFGRVSERNDGERLDPVGDT